MSDNNIYAIRRGEIITPSMVDSINKIMEFDYNSISFDGNYLYDWIISIGSLSAITIDRRTELFGGYNCIISAVAYNILHLGEKSVCDIGYDNVIIGKDKCTIISENYKSFAKIKQSNRTEILSNISGFNIDNFINYIRKELT